jgi:hypothetical protein
MAGSGRQNADEILIAALAGGATVAVAAQQAGVGERTVWRRLQADDFRARLDAARRQSLASALDVLTKVSTAAAATLADLLKKEYAPSVRLGAARSILDLSIKAEELRELTARGQALETGQPQRVEYVNDWRQQP